MDRVEPSHTKRRQVIAVCCRGSELPAHEAVGLKSAEAYTNDWASFGICKAAVDRQTKPRRASNHLPEISCEQSRDPNYIDHALGHGGWHPCPPTGHLMLLPIAQAERQRDLRHAKHNRVEPNQPD